MCNRIGEDVAYGAFLLRPVRQTVRRRWFPRKGRQAVLPGRLFRHVRPEMRRMQSPDHGKLRVRPQFSMAR